MKKIVTSTAQETIDLGFQIGQKLKSGDVVLLSGDLSAGKTTLTKGIGKALGIDKVINSPTFTIVKTYQGTKDTLYHLDLYRLDGLNQDFDLEEYIESEGICVIEWPFQVKELLPESYLMVTLKRIDEMKREIQVEAIGTRYLPLEGEINV